MIKVTILGVRLEPESGQPIVLLKENGGERLLPIWIGVAEAVAIALQLEDIPTTRPMTHDLFKNAITAMGSYIERVVVTEVAEETYIAEIHFKGKTSTVIDARPSDAIALAIRFDAPVFVEDSVMNQAGVTLEPEEDEVAKFVDFLDHVDPEDFRV